MVVKQTSSAALLQLELYFLANKATFIALGEAATIILMTFKLLNVSGNKRIIVNAIKGNRINL